MTSANPRGSRAANQARAGAAGANARHRRRSDRQTDVVDSGLPTPLYHQIYVLLRDQILSGAFAEQARIPGEHELVARYGVSRITARRALDELAADGLVVRRRGRGTSLAAPVQSPPFDANISGLLENLLMMGLKTKVRILEFGYVEPSESIRQALQLEPGTNVQRAVRVRSYRGEPLSYTVSFVPEHIGRAYTRRDLAATPLLALLERAGCLIGSADQVIGATLADSVVAPRLNVKVGSALLSVTRTVFDPDGRPVEHIRILYRPDRYQYRMKLARVQDLATKLWSPTA